MAACPHRPEGGGKGVRARPPAGALNRTAMAEIEDGAGNYLTFI
jgi:hypothetical protein